MRVEARSWILKPEIPVAVPLREGETLLRWAVTAVTPRGWLVEGAVLTGPGHLIGQGEEEQRQDERSSPQGKG